MNDHDIKLCIAHLWKLYERAEERWPKERQLAFCDQLRRYDIEFEQFRAVSNDVAMRSRSSWRPPEAELLKRLDDLRAKGQAGRTVNMIDIYRARQAREDFYAGSDCGVLRAECDRENEYLLKTAVSDEHRRKIKIEAEKDVRTKCERFGVEYVPDPRWS